MSFLLDTDIASAYLKGNAAAVSKVMLHYGALQTSVVTVGELLTWALRAKAPAGRLDGVMDFLRATIAIEIDFAIAEKFGQLRAVMLDRGHQIDGMDLMIAATAIVHDLILVTHNVSDFKNVPDLKIDDWITP